MKKEYRLKKNQDFQNVINKKCFVSNDSYTMYYYKNAFEYSRIGISVSKKIGNSVVRHKVKRQINEIIRKLCNLDLSYDIIIIARSKFLDNDFQRNYLSLETLYKKMKERIEGTYEKEKKSIN
ncbi:MAG: ribonuclease P protein component [Erysipelotrichaceae bacterium]|nr:ribonuclease P protein component [Erysipelotrichaceae bacterium]